MKLNRRKFLAASSVVGLSACAKAQVLEESLRKTGLAAAFGDDFLIGAAVSTDSLLSDDQRTLALIKSEFSSITAENCQKWEEIHPALDQWSWEASDKFVEFGVKNNKHMLGHTLVWHSQIPKSVFEDTNGAPISSRKLQGRMEDHISTLMERYKGKINTWDVVNEAVTDNGNNDWRKSPWFEIMGSGFMEHAFRTAHQVDPEAQLLYNDYNMHNPNKRRFLNGVFKDYLERDVPIKGVGLQGHYMLDEPELEQIEQTIKGYAALGLPIHITELDIDVLPQAYEYMGAEISTSFEYSDKLNPYPDELPDIIKEELATRYEKLFGLFLKHRKSIERVTLWGVSDGQSWKNDWPVRGRTNFPLLFDREFEPKEAYHRIRKLKS